MASKVVHGARSKAEARGSQIGVDGLDVLTIMDVNWTWLGVRRYYKFLLASFVLFLKKPTFGNSLTGGFRQKCTPACRFRVFYQPLRPVTTL